MRVFLTGATGFLGSRILPLLEDHEVLFLTRGQPRYLPQYPFAQALVGDLSQSGNWKGTVESFAPEWCIHLGWEGLPDYSLPRCRANLDAGIGLFDLLIRCGVKKILVAGSCWEYGDATGAVKEDRYPVDCGVFAATKHALHVVLQSIARSTGIDYRWSRIFFAYGPGQRHTSLIPHCHAAYSAGEIPDIRDPAIAQDFVHVDDVARGIIEVLQSNAGSGVFNIGSGIPATVAQVVNQVAGHFGASPPFSSIEPGAGFWADTSRTTALTGWQARIPLAEGIAQALAALDCP